MTLSDEALVARARNGDRAAFDELVERYQSLVYHFCLRYCGQPDDARERAQDTFVRVWLKLGTFQTHRPLRPWLYKVAAGVCLNAAARRRPVLSLDTAESDDRTPEPASRPADDPARVAEARQMQAAVHRAMLELPPAYRVVMILRHVEHLDYRDIATALELPLGTVKTHLFRARQQLRQRLGELLPASWGDDR